MWSRLEGVSSCIKCVCACICFIRLKYVCVDEIIPLVPTSTVSEWNEEEECDDEDTAVRVAAVDSTAKVSYQIVELHFKVILTQV